MVVKFFMLQTHYRSTLDFSNDALNAAEKGFVRIAEAYKTLRSLKAASTSSENIAAIETACYEAMNDDFNTSVLIAHLFETVRIINSANDGKVNLTQADIDLLHKIYKNFVFDVCGLKFEEESGEAMHALDKVVNVVLDMRAKAKADKNFPLSDEIRNKLTEAGIKIKDSKEGSTWSL